jgi:NodT family efflux transporter outer membrane factor (OMF) lipoprotein
VTSRTHLPALAAALALAGCASMAPPYERPAAPVAAAFPQAGAATGTPAAQTDWRAFFTDARLARLIELALADNRDLRVAVLNIEAARAQLGIQRAGEFPTVAVAAGEQRQTGSPTIYSAGLAVSSWELDLWGRVRSLTAAAAAQLGATQEARKAAQISLVASVANAWAAIGADDAQAELARRTLATRVESLALTQLRFDNGVASDLDLQTAKSQVEAARVALASAQRQRALDEDALVLLVGRPLPADLPPAAAWSATTLPDVPAGLPSDVLLQRPDVRQAEQQLIAANANIGAARAAFFPTISLTGSYGTASTQFNQLFDHQAWSFVPQLVLPIFDAGRNRANLRASEASRDIAVASYERAVQAAFRDVADALAGRATLSDQLRAQQAQADAEARRLELSSLRFRSGVASSLELLDAQRSLFAAQQATVSAQLGLLQNRIALYRALGGGWTEPARTANAR